MPRRRLSKQPIRAKGALVLEDGTRFIGQVFGYPVASAGEVVFTTGMVGYPESLTDPSYTGQLMVMTYPLAGNYGVEPISKNPSRPQQHFESSRIHASALIVSSLTMHPSHYRSARTLDSWLHDERIIGLSGIDTRALTQRLREHGTMLGKIVVDNEIPWYDPNKENLVDKVSIHRPLRYRGSGKRVAVVDCGVKHGILRELISRSCDILRVPWDYPISSLKGIDGVVVSNGPGDPMMAEKTVYELKRLIARKVPVWGICLGHQLLALALGATTYKLPYGHRGHNQPVEDVLTRHAYITSQNHGFAVRESTLPRSAAVWFRNLNDGTHEGFKHTSLPVRGVQFHPEACPGPRDTEFLFDEFMKLL